MTDCTVVAISCVADAGRARAKFRFSREAKWHFLPWMAEMHNAVARLSEEISKIYYKKKKVVAGRSVISRVLHRLNLRHKKLSIYAAEQDHEEVKKKR